MSDPDDDYQFEKFQRGPLPIDVPRQEFFWTLFNDFIVHCGKMDGGMGFKLAELGNWHDEDLFGIIPVIVPGTEVKINRKYVFGKPPKGNKTYRLFSVDSPALTAFNLINGENSLTEIAGTLRQVTGWDEAPSFSFVRGLFLSLVTIGMVQPKY